MDNLASAPETELAKAPAVRKRIPLSTPQRKLQVPDIEGHHTYWFLESNVPAAIQGGYDFVDSQEVSLNAVSVGTPSAVSGNADLGSQVRIIGGTAADGRAESLVLMKIREEWWKEDQRVLEERNASILSAIFKDEKILGSEQVSPEDRGTRYVKTALFGRPTRKGK